MTARVLYCIPGAWTDFWFDDPNAWWQWVCAFKRWRWEEWLAFYGRWRTAPAGTRQKLMAEHGLYFFDWRRVDGGSLWSSSRAAASVIAQDLLRLPDDADITLVGHSKGGSALKHLIARVARGDVSLGPRQLRAIFIDAPVDRLRELSGVLMGLKTEPCSLDGTCGIPMATINNWLDPSGGRLRGVPNYQVLLWQDYLRPYPPHGMKGALAERVLRDLGALPNCPANVDRARGVVGGGDEARREPAHGGAGR